MTGRIAMICQATALLVLSTTTTANAQTLPAQDTRRVPAKPVQADSEESSSMNARSGEDDSSRHGSSDDSTDNTFRSAPKHFLLDQRAIWTSPAKIRLEDAIWLLPLAGFTAGLFGQDQDVSRHLNTNPNTLHRYQQLSNYGVGAMGGMGAGLYLLGLKTHNEHERETGFLAGEAAMNSLVVVEALKYMTGRERPNVDNASGGFWKGGNSFPSEHAAAAWAIAGIVAHEYPGPLTQLAAYGLAGAISVSRINGRQHFPSDVLVGSAIGWLTSHYIYTKHHDPSLSGGTWRMSAFRPEWPSHWKPRSMSSPYVPLDSWVYPGLLRLAALGFVSSDAESMRPWTRMECARLVEEAGDRLRERETDPTGAVHLYESLAREFSAEINLLGGGDNRVAHMESVYARTTQISGQPLRDGFDFGQTIINDYGRPYAEGSNNIIGASGWFSDGPFVGYVRGEYQSSPSSPSLPGSALQAISQEELLPVPPATPTPSTSRFDMLIGYAGMQLDNWQITFGKQEEWWGPDAGGAMLFSNNSEPIEMLQINRTTPFQMPGFLKLLGPTRVDFFLGRIGGYHWLFTTDHGFTGSWTSTLANQPFFGGYQVTLRPTANFEVGISVASIFAGEGLPFTFHRFALALFSPAHGAATGSVAHPGFRNGGLDFRWRVPGLRRWLTLYGDGFTRDEPNPAWGSNGDKSAFVAGLYFSHLPMLPKLDLRVEGVFTDNPNPNPQLQHGFFYWEDTYRQGYTNDGNLIGSWIGRQSQGAQAWTTYWFTPKNTLQIGYRHQKASRELVPFGGTVTDASARADFWVGSRYSVTASVQYEKWAFPVLSAAEKSNLATAIQFTYWPRHWGVRANASHGTGGQGSAE